MDTKAPEPAGTVGVSGGGNNFSPAKRIRFLNVPLDIVLPEDFPALAGYLLPPGGGIPGTQPGKGRNIVLLSLWDLLRARRNNRYREYVLGAALVIPISKSLVSGVKFLTGETLVRYMPFKFVISLLSVLEQGEHSLYLLGGGNKALLKAGRNLHSTFPRIKIVGRRAGRIKKQDEPAVVEAIRKSSPSLLLAGKGIPGGELWIAGNSGSLNPGLRLWCSDLFDVFAEKKRRPGNWVFEKGLESAAYCFRNPLKILRIFPYFRYKLLLLFYKLSGK